MLLGLPWLKLIGGALLLWIGVKLLVPEHEGEGDGIADSRNLITAIRTIIIADLVMSLDNVLAVAAAAKDHVGLVVFGLLFSIPIIVYGSRLIIRLMDRFPIIITLGGALLGYIAGDMAVKDVVVKDWVAANAAVMQYVMPWLCAAVVVMIGKWLVARMARPELVEVVEERHKGGD
jgi:predicted tellurium resistance membrane protein TerC